MEENEKQLGSELKSRSMGKEESQAVIESYPVKYDAALFEKAHTQWQFGDWESLCRLGDIDFQHHPDRAKLALLAASAHHQGGSMLEARRWVLKAIEWGCDKQLVCRVLISGVYNTLGCAAEILNQQKRAFRHMRNAIAQGAPAEEIGLISKARIQQQREFLEYRKAEYIAECQNKKGEDLYKSGRLVEAEDCFKKATEYMSTSTIYRYNLEETIRELECERIARYCSTEQFNEVDSFSFNFNRGAITINEYTSKLSELLGLDLSSYNFTHKRTVYNIVFVRGDHIPVQIEKNSNFYEKECLEILGCFYTKGSFIIDAGANIGNHTLYFAGELGANVIAFEPEPHNSAILRANINLNSVNDKVGQYCVALGSAAGDVELTMNVKNNYGSFTAYSDANPNADILEVKDNIAIEVPVRTLDYIMDCTKGEYDISILKIDIEGMELELLQGAEMTIKSNYPVIAIECFNEDVYSSVEKILGPIGYFSIDMVNSTPTFIFANENNPYHIKALSYLMKTKSLDKAKKRKGFS